MEAGPTKTNWLKSLLLCARPVLEKKHINSLCYLIFRTLMLLENKNNAKTSKSSLKSWVSWFGQ
jgi:hypothetical protein